MLGWNKPCMPRKGLLGVFLFLAFFCGVASAHTSGTTALPWRGDHAGQSLYDRFIKGHLYLAPGATYIDFNNLKSSNLNVSGVRFPTSLAIGNGPVAGAKATVDNKTIPTLSIGYFLPGTHRHLSLNTILGTPIHFHFSAQPGPLRDDSLAPSALGIPTGIPALGSDIGKVKTLPIMMTLLYHPFPNAIFQPYIGAGGAYVYNYDAKITNSVLTEENQPGFDVSDTWGYLLEAGFDVGQKKSSGLYAFGDVRYLGGAHIKGRLHNVHVRVRNQTLAGALGLLGYSDDARVGDSSIGLSLNALIFTAGVGYRF